MGRSQDRKGADGERAAAQNLREFYFADDAERAPRKDRGDLEGAETVRGVGMHAEVKSHAKHAAYKFIEQAVSQKGADEWPLVMLHGNYKKNWLYVIRDVDILDFVRGYLRNRRRAWTRNSPFTPTSSSSRTLTSPPSGEDASDGIELLSEELVSQRFEEWRRTTSSSPTSIKSSGSGETSGGKPGLEPESS